MPLRKSLRRSVAGLLALQTVAASPVGINRHTESKVRATTLGAVASETDICSRIGTDLLKMGGNAADAMVGTVACVGVVGMYHSGQ